jgi:hypothetical protein
MDCNFFARRGSVVIRESKKPFWHNTLMEGSFADLLGVSSLTAFCGALSALTGFGLPLCRIQSCAVLIHQFPHWKILRKFGVGGPCCAAEKADNALSAK